MTRLVALREVIEKSTGSRNPTVKPDDPFTYVDVSAIDNEQKVITGARQLLGAEAPSRARKLLRSHDVLVSTVRPNLNAVAVVPPELDGQVGSTGFCVLRAVQDKALPAFLFYFVRSRRFVDALSGLVAGALYPAVTDSQVLAQEVPLPSLSEQQRIVDQLSRAEGIVRLRRQAQQKAAELIPAIFVDMFGDPAMNPKGWPIQTIGDLTTYTRYGPRFHDRGYADDGAHILRTTDMGYAGELAWQQSPKLAVSDTELQRYSLKPGTLLVTRTGATIGKTALFRGAPEPCIAGAYLIEVGLSDRVVPDYVLHALLGAYGQAQLSRGTRTVAQPNINVPAICAIRLPVPALTEQQRFERLVQMVESIATQQNRAAQSAEAAFNALLAGAFSASGRAAVNAQDVEGSVT